MKRNNTQPYIREDNNTISFVGDGEKIFLGDAQNMKLMALWDAKNIKIKDYKFAANIDLSYKNVENIEISDINSIGYIRLTSCEKLENLKIYNVGSIYNIAIQLSPKIKNIEIMSTENPKYFYVNHVNAESVNINGQEYRQRIDKAQLIQNENYGDIRNIMEMNQDYNGAKPENIQNIDVAANINSKKSEKYKSGLTSCFKCATM